jgi:uridine kinase
VDDPDVRIILLAGPSGSGKTTTANLIADAVRARGEESLVVSLDDFYRDYDDPNYPRTQCGERDLECPEALKLDELSTMLSDMAAGKSFKLPKYDFKLGRCVSVAEHSPMPDGCLIIEGLHALNPQISSKLRREWVLKIFVSVSTNVNDGDLRILSGRKLRFVRRMVRDSIYRGTDVGRTLELWQGVLAAEDVHLYPYKPEADMAFDTFHPFEIGVMRRFALPYLTEELALENEYVSTVREALLAAVEIEDSLVPDSSLIREFIPGGVYESLY